MAAYAAVVSLMNNIEQMKSHPRLSTSFDNKHIQPLVQKAGFLLDYIEGCFSHGGGNKVAAEDLERRIASAAHEAEDVIESHIVDQIYAGTGEVSLRCSLQLQQIIQDIDAIINEATKVKQSWEEVKSTHTAAAAAEPLTESGETSMVGLDEELIKLLDELTGYRSSRHIISIVGMGGMGKTTLAKNIYQHALVKEHFEIHAWATISQRHNAREILLKLLSSTKKSTSETVDALGEELHKTLYGRRYLIILDDIWSVEAWNNLRRYFPDNENRSRVLLTTRLWSVANDCGSSYCLKMDFLDDDKSWKLFCEKAAVPHEDDPPQLEGVGKQIVRSCKGLALSIAVMAGLLLRSPRTVKYWNSVAKDIKPFRGLEAKQESLDVLSLSYSHLPPHLKPCFLYMGVFREDSEIRVWNLIKLWVAEGFIKPPNGSSRELEEVAEGYIKELIDRNLILVGKRRSNGKIGYCGIHDSLRDLSLKLAQEENFFHVVKDSIQGTERRLVGFEIECRYDLDLEELPLDVTLTKLRLLSERPIINYSFPDVTNLRLARSVINHRGGPLAVPVIDYWGGPLVKSRLLRVFYHRESWKDIIEYYENVNLRYLAYSYMYAGALKIPASLCLLWNLQTLIIEQFDFPWGEVCMPDEFWKMRQLKHVECGRVCLPNPPEDELLMLEKLQSLKTVLNLRLNEKVCNMITNIKKLHLTFHDSYHHVYDESCIECLCNLELLQKLESFKLTFDSRNTKEVNMDAVRFPCSLKKLSLEECRLGWEDDMAKIGMLPELEVLKLDRNSVTKGGEWSPVNEQFLRLNFLRIRSCTLLDWKVESSHFPVLEKLLLEYLNKLKEIPSDIGEIQTLQLIRVDCCSEDAAVSAIKIKENRLEFDDNDDLRIQVVVHRSKFESFTERLKEEELTVTVSNIELERRLTDSTVEAVGRIGGI